MKYTLIRELYKSNIDTYQDKEIEIAGWVRTIRSSKNFGFIAYYHMQSTSSSKKEISYMYILQLLQVVMQKVLEKCSM